MNCENKEYSLSESAKRMDTAIRQTDKAVCIRDSIKESEDGEFAMFQTAYINATVMSIVVHSETDWEDSQGEVELALGYKTIFQESIRLLKSCDACRSYFNDGYHVIAVFDTPQKNAFKEIVDLSAKITTMIDIWRFKRDRNNLCDFRCSIGIDYGHLMKFNEDGTVHKGYKDIYLGPAMQKANQLSYQPMPEKQFSCIRLSSITYQNLNQEYQKMFLWDVKYDSYRSTLYNIDMRKWLLEKEAKR